MDRAAGWAGRLAVLDRAVRPGDSDDLRLRKRLLARALLVSIPIALGAGAVTALGGAVWSGLVLIGQGLFTMPLLAAFLNSRRGFALFAAVSLAIPLVSPVILMIILGAPFPALGEILWGVLAPSGALILLPEQARRWFVAYAVAVVGLMLLSPSLVPLEQVTPAAVPVLLFINFVGPSAFVMGVLYFFMAARNRALALLQQEEEKSEALLRNVLPAEVAAILRDDQRIIADQFENVSVLFADLVVFSPLSARLSAVELVTLLNEIFSHFDSLVEQYGLEKIKTIGDCYMVAAGVPRPRADHATVLAHLALEMQAYMATQTFMGHRLSLRIGLNSGPVVAGVIGTHKFIYDLWGDAVNIASRMESHGKGGAIQLSRSTYDLIQATFTCEPRGVLPIKGKGEMEVWYLLGGPDSAARRPAPAVGVLSDG
jgi:guanylate cyclase